MKQNIEWYKIFQIDKNTYRVNEPGHVSFYILNPETNPVFIDTGLGLNENIAHQLLRYFGISKFRVFQTHTHCDHIGLNYLAEKIYINKEEYQKFRNHNDEKQISYYYELLSDEKKWPLTNYPISSSKIWKNNIFIDSNDILKIDSERELISISTPGHTVGHTIFFDKKSNYLFLGDFVYNGTLFANFKDSSLEQYKSSLNKVMEIIEKYNPILLPSHNSIPLPKSVFCEIHSFFNSFEFKKGYGKLVKKNKMFHESYQFDERNFRVQINKDLI